MGIPQPEVAGSSPIRGGMGNESVRHQTWHYPRPWLQAQQVTKLEGNAVTIKPGLQRILGDFQALLLIPKMKETCNVASERASQDWNAD
jgi:hypothetical protein